MDKPLSEKQQWSECIGFVFCSVWDLHSHLVDLWLERVFASTRIGSYHFLCFGWIHNENCSVNVLHIGNIDYYQSKNKKELNATSSFNLLSASVAAQITFKWEIHVYVSVFISLSLYISLFRNLSIHVNHPMRT